MKRKMHFTLTIGSQWVEGHIFPQGGKITEKTVEFETDGVDPYNDAVEALREQIGNKSFHIFYWEQDDVR